MSFDPSSRSAQIVAALERVSSAIRDCAAEDAAPAGLTVNQARVLRLIDNHGGGPVRLVMAAKALSMSTRSCTDAVTALCGQGLLRSTTASRGSARTVSLTDAGRGALEASGEWERLLVQAAGNLPDADQTALLRALVKLIRTLQKKRQVPVARMCSTCRFFRPHLYPDRTEPHHCDLVGQSFGDGALRVECPEHEAAAVDPAGPDGSA